MEGGKVPLDDLNAKTAKAAKDGSTVFKIFCALCR